MKATYNCSDDSSESSITLYFNVPIELTLGEVRKIAKEEVKNANNSFFGGK